MSDRLKQREGIGATCMGKYNTGSSLSLVLLGKRNRFLGSLNVYKFGLRRQNGERGAGSYWLGSWSPKQTSIYE